MNWFRKLRLRFRALTQKEHLDARMDKELRSHIEMQTQENIEAGMPPEEARRTALRDFGRIETIKDNCRDQRGVTWLEELLQDLSYGLRMLGKSPAFSAVAILTLAVGIGATTTVFSVINGVLLNPLDYPDSDRIVYVWESDSEQGTSRANTSPANFADWRNENTVFEALAFTVESFGHTTRSFVLTGQGMAERLRGRFVPTDFFRVFGVAPMLGRTFLPEEEKPGAGRVVVISHQLWQDHFGSDPAIVGKTITLENQGRHTWEVIGVMPPGFRYPGSSLWVSMAHSFVPMARRGGTPVQAIARLKPGVTVARAEAEMNVIQSRIHSEYSHIASQGKHLAIGSRIKIEPMLEAMVGNVRWSLQLFFVAVVFVLLIACANVANLLLTRGLSRAREIAIRTALGARRSRIVRQLLTESVLLALIGGSAGGLLAFWGVKLVVRFSDGSIPRIHEAALDVRALGFALFISLLTGLIFGLAPAWQTSRIDLDQALKEGTQRAAGGARNYLSHAFSVSEVALALILLVAAGLLIQSFLRLQSVDPGFKAAGLLTVEVDMAAVAYPNNERRRVFFRDLLERMRAVPGVQAVCGVSMIPDRGGGWPTEYYRPDRPVPSRSEQPIVGVRAVTPGFSETFGIPLMKGRDFTEADSASAPKVVLINQAFADAVFPGEDPIGRSIHCGGLKEIIGILGNVKNSGLAGETRREVFVTYQQWEWPSSFLVVRAQGDLNHLTPVITSHVRALNPGQPLVYFRTMSDYLDSATASPRFRSMLIGLFALTALVLAAVGIYGVMAVSVAQRTQEIGVRMALGARKVDVLMLVLRRGMRLTLFGVILGILSSLALTRVLASQLYGITALDPFTFAAVPLLLALVAGLACLLPARRATKVDPIIALRHE